MVFGTLATQSSIPRSNRDDAAFAKAKELDYKAKMFTRKTFMSLRMGVMPEG